MITLAEVQALFNRGELRYYDLARGDRWRVRREFIAWRLDVLGGICPVCEKPLDPVHEIIVIDHQHPMDRARNSDGTVLYGVDQLRGYVREVVHHRCNMMVLMMELGYTPKYAPAYLVYWYRIAYARMDEPRPS